MDVKNLYDKVAEFETRLSSSASALSNCKKGCARCCYTDISVFEVEAQNIEAWFNNLSDEFKIQLFKKWEHFPEQTEDFHGIVTEACPFLFENSCTIYEARPLICRTQGMAFKFSENGTSFQDICPLNEGMLKVLTEKEILNLDLLNTILAQLEKLSARNSSRERIKLKELRNKLWTQFQKH